jgi:DNA-binding Xre family transcriptional regulator
MAKEMTAQEMAAEVIYKFGSQKDAARMCGLSQGTLSLVVNGKLKDAKLSTIDKLKRGLKMKK